MAKYLIPCLLGLEKLVGDEIKRLGLQDVQVENGRVLCRGSLADCARLNINLRCGARVMLVVKTFQARTFEELFQIFLNGVDPFDPDGQFIDRGHSYTLAVYHCSESQQKAAEAAVRALAEESGQSVYVSIEPFTAFYKAEEEHQDYYLKHPEEFRKELIESGRIEG